MPLSDAEQSDLKDKVDRMFTQFTTLEQRIKNVEDRPSLNAGNPIPPRPTVTSTVTQPTDSRLPPIIPGPTPPAA